MLHQIARRVFKNARLQLILIVVVVLEVRRLTALLVRLPDPAKPNEMLGFSTASTPAANRSFVVEPRAKGKIRWIARAY